MLLLSCATTVTFARDDVCFTDLSHPDAPFRQAGPLLGFSQDQLNAFLVKGHDILSNAPPSIETCLASYQSSQILEILPQVIGKCLKVATIQNLPVAKELTSAFDVQKFKANPLYVVDYAVHNISSPQFTSMCSPIMKDVLPCLATALPRILDSLQSNSNGCCDPFFKDAQTKFGVSLTDMLLSLIPKLADVLCSVRTPGFNDHASQTCAYTMVQTFLGVDPFQVLNMFKISNANGCRASKGESFTTGVSDQLIVLGNEAAGITIDSCAVPMDNLVSEFARFPFFQSHPLWSKLFADDQVVSGMDLTSYLPVMAMDSMYGMNISAMMMDQMTFHFPSGFAEACDFNSTVVLASSLCDEAKKNQRGDANVIDSSFKVTVNESVIIDAVNESANPDAVNDNIITDSVIPDAVNENIMDENKPTVTNTTSSAGATLGTSHVLALVVMCFMTALYWFNLLHIF